LVEIEPVKAYDSLWKLKHFLNKLVLGCCDFKTEAVKQT
jgi:hypothetical protein